MGNQNQTPPRPSQADTNRRAELVDKWAFSKLDAAEAEELRILEAAADRYLDAVSPIQLESLEWLERQIAELEASPVPRGGNDEPMETYSIWEGPDGQALVRGTDPPKFHNGRPIDPDAVKVLEFQAASWDEACQRYHDHYGWGEYKPMAE